MDIWTKKDIIWAYASESKYNNKIDISLNISPPLDGQDGQYIYELMLIQIHYNPDIEIMKKAITDKYYMFKARNEVI